MSILYKIFIFPFLIGFYFCTSPKDKTLQSEVKQDSEINNEVTRLKQNIDKYWPEGIFIQNIELKKCIYIERWVKSKDCRMMEGNYIQTEPLVDTLFSMHGKLFFENNVCKFIYTTNLEKNEIEFVLSKNTDNEFVFENPFRTFPSIMKYTFISDSVFEVLERGFSSGNEREVIYKVRKM